MNVLINFRHGLGDAVQLTLVLKHLRHYHPDWQIDVASLAGKHSAFHGLCRRSVLLSQQDRFRGRYDRVYDLDWPECPTCYAGWPSSKAERCLVDVFQLNPIPEMCRYEIRRGQHAMRLARRYLEGTCKATAAEAGRYPAVLIHYEGNTSAEHKNLPVETARRLCEEIVDCGAIPVILDWDSRSPLPDGKRIHNPHADLELWGGTGTGDAEVLAALVELSTLLVGVDSGPLHVAGATSTPTLGVWTGHHPLHYFSLADNVVHLVPRDHARLLRGDREVGERYFRQHYRYRPYDDLQEALIAAVRERLQETCGGLVFTRSFWIRPAMAKQDLVVVEDVAEKDAYRIEQLPMPRPVVVDVGAHIGCFSRKLHERNPLAHIIALECCPENIPALKKNVGGFATVVQAAVTYQKDVALMSAVYPGCLSTGGSRIVDRRQLKHKVTAGDLRETPGSPPNTEYWADFRPIRTITLEEILQEHGLDRIDVLKLDCEGSEMSILRNTSLLDKIGIIIGEYHDQKAFMELVEERFSGWHLRILKDGEPGLFWLRRGGRREPVHANDSE